MHSVDTPSGNTRPANRAAHNLVTPSDLTHLVHANETFAANVFIPTLLTDGTRHTYGLCSKAAKAVDPGNPTYRNAPLKDFLAIDDCDECRNQHQPGGRLWTWLRTALNPLHAADLHQRGLVDAQAARGAIGPTEILDSTTIGRLLATLPAPERLQPGPVVGITRPTSGLVGAVPAPYDQIYRSGTHLADGRSIVSNPGQQLLRFSQHVQLGHLPAGVDGEAAAEIFLALVRDGAPTGVDTWASACRLAT